MKRLSISRTIAVASGSLAAAVCSAAPGMDPSQLFDKVSPSVWVVRTYDAAERPVGQGSAVVVSRGRLITNCHVLVNSKEVYVRRDNVMYQAKLEFADAPRDLCQLQVDHFDAPAVVVRPVSGLKIGEHVFAIGNPRGMEVTLSDGLVSGLRETLPGLPMDQGGSDVIQTTTPISPGSSGGGLFDAEGRLIGITSMSRRDAQNINIALPADWIAQVPARARAALAKRGAPQVSVSPAAGLPAAGTVWTYSVVERIFSSTQLDVTVRVLQVDDAAVKEEVTSKAGGGKDVQRVINARESRFVEFALDSDNDMVELSPYLLAINDNRIPTDLQTPTGYPIGTGALPQWSITIKDRAWEQVTVHAGTFRALRLDVVGSRSPGNRMRGNAGDGRFEMSVWYAPDVKRFVKLVRKIWSADTFSPTQTGDNVIELLAYRPPS